MLSKDQRKIFNTTFSFNQLLNTKLSTKDQVKKINPK